MRQGEPVDGEPTYEELLKYGHPYGSPDDDGKYFQYVYAGTKYMVIHSANYILTSPFQNAGDTVYL